MIPPHIVEVLRTFGLEVGCLQLFGWRILTLREGN